MIGLCVLLGALVWIVTTVLYRGKRRTENVDGLLLEQVRTGQARADQSLYRSDEALLSSTLRDRRRL